MTGLLRGLTVSGVAAGVLVFMGASPSWASSVTPWYDGNDDAGHHQDKYEDKKHGMAEKDRPKYVVKAYDDKDKDHGYDDGHGMHGKGHADHANGYAMHDDNGHDKDHGNGHGYGHYVKPAHKEHDKQEKKGYGHGKHAGQGYGGYGNTVAYHASQNNYARTSYVAALTEKATYEVSFDADKSYGYSKDYDGHGKHGKGYDFGGYGYFGENATVKASYERSAFFAFESVVSQSATVHYASDAYGGYGGYGKHGGYGHDGSVSSYVAADKYAKVSVVSAEHEKAEYEADYSADEGYGYSKDHDRHGKRGGHDSEYASAHSSVDYSEKASYERSQYVAHEEERSESYAAGYTADYATYKGHDDHDGYAKDWEKDESDEHDGYNGHEKSYDDEHDSDEYKADEHDKDYEHEDHDSDDDDDEHDEHDDDDNWNDNVEHGEDKEYATTW